MSWAARKSGRRRRGWGSTRQRRKRMSRSPRDRPGAVETPRPADRRRETGRDDFVLETDRSDSSGNGSDSFRKSLCTKGFIQIHMMEKSY
jgi:hypothetical protein